MNEHTFKVGDIVRLKSSAPERIATISEVLAGSYVTLVWKSGPQNSNSSCHVR
jgi:uncharacterized protein YodC (DUF2158 family)